MERLTYKQAETKIFDAYFRDEIEPMRSKFCFCGTLSPDEQWLFSSNRNLKYPYTTTEYCEMEYALFSGIMSVTKYDSVTASLSSPKYEEALFNGMCKALDALKQIHLDRGEIIDEPIQLKKRELVNT